MSRNVWAGIDTGKIGHHCVVINDAGEKLLSRKVSNDETDVLQLIGEVTTLADGGRLRIPLLIGATGPKGAGVAMRLGADGLISMFDVVPGLFGHLIHFGHVSPRSGGSGYRRRRHSSRRAGTAACAAKSDAIRNGR